jgi:hypothetical protein
MLGTAYREIWQVGIGIYQTREGCRGACWIESRGLNRVALAPPSSPRKVDTDL